MKFRELKEPFNLYPDGDTESVIVGVTISTYEVKDGPMAAR